MIALLAEHWEQKLDCSGLNSEWQVQKWTKSQGFSFENFGEEMEDRDFEVAERKVCARISKSFLSSA